MLADAPGGAAAEGEVGGPVFRGGGEPAGGEAGLEVMDLVSVEGPAFILGDLPPV